VERQYLADLLAVVRALDQAARAEVQTRGQELLDAYAVRRDAEHREDAWFDLLAMLLLRIALEVASQLLDAERLIPLRARQAADFNLRDWRAVVRRAYGVDIVRGNESWMLDTLRAFEAENLGLIRSIPERYVERLRGEFTRAVTEGRSLRDMTRMVQETTGTTRKRAELIARDQIGKLNGQLQERRQRDIGVRSFIWRTVGDERVRPTHRQRHGKEFSYEEPGPRPGAEIRCRCSAAPVLPGLTAEEVRGFG
jgi:SPP1 gp7 family putative phage head morphogenesis protein